MKPEDIPDQINQTLYAHMGTDERKRLSLKTQMEMARGALGHAVDKQIAMKYVNELGVLADGERKLRAVLTKDWRLHVYRESKTYGDVVVAVGRVGDLVGAAPLFLKEPLEGFPSDELLTKVMLVAG